MNDFYCVKIIIIQLSYTTLHSHGVNLTHQCYYTMAWRPTQSLTIFVCSVFNLNNKNVNALVAHELSGFTCTCSLTMNSKFSIPIRARCEKDLRDNKDNSLHLGRKYARIFVLGHYLFLVAHSFPRTTLSENCSLLGTDNVCGQISVHIFAPNGGYCLYITEGLLAPGE